MQNVIERNASGKSGELPCYKCIFEQLRANLAKIQPENCQNVQKARVLQKAPGINELKCGVDILVKKMPVSCLHE